MLLRDLIGETDISMHSISSRLKERESLKGKLTRSETSYGDLRQITDIAGVRIITYMADDVDKVGELVAKEFTIDEANSIDKRASLDPDRFGYLSLHHVVTLPERRTALAEYGRFRDLKIEIQTRSILQHAWAEIEHDLGYKAKEEVPSHIRRRFSRVAGLLELADQEFMDIRDELGLYEETVSAEIEETPQSVGIDGASLLAFLTRDGTVHFINHAIAELLKGDLEAYNSKSDIGRLGHIINRLMLLGIDTIDELERQLVEHRDLVVTFAASYIVRRQIDGIDRVPVSIGFHYLCHLLAAKKNDRGLARKVFSGIGPDEDREDLLEAVFAAYHDATTGR